MPNTCCWCCHLRRAEAHCATHPAGPAASGVLLRRQTPSRPAGWQSKRRTGQSSCRQGKGQGGGRAWRAGGGLRRPQAGKQQGSSREAAGAGAGAGAGEGAGGCPPPPPPPGVTAGPSGVWLTHAGKSLLCRRPKVWRGRFLNIRMPAAAAWCVGGVGVKWDGCEWVGFGWGQGGQGQGTMADRCITPADKCCMNACRKIVAACALHPVPEPTPPAGATHLR